ncbi:hypothetical protein MRX96_037335 [Rhipicephalus microplus]
MIRGLLRDLSLACESGHSWSRGLLQPHLLHNSKIKKSEIYRVTFLSSDSDAKACAYEREFNKLFRIPAKRPKVVGFIEDVVRQYSDHEFRRHFRLARPVAEKLVAEFAVSTMCPSSTHGRVQAKSAETHVLTFIWYAANKTCMRDVASRFDMSENTVYRVLQRVAQFLMTLGPSVIKFPADLENLTSSFEKQGGLCSDGGFGGFALRQSRVLARGVGVREKPRLQWIPCCALEEALPFVGLYHQETVAWNECCWVSPISSKTRSVGAGSRNSIQLSGEEGGGDGINFGSLRPSSPALPLLGGRRGLIWIAAPVSPASRRRWVVAPAATFPSFRCCRIWRYDA